MTKERVGCATNAKKQENKASKDGITIKGKSTSAVSVTNLKDLTK
jgi:hypothetical protein